MLAHALVDVLHSRGHKPVVLKRADCDISKADEVRRAFEMHSPTLVLNCAAHTGVDACEDELDKANAINGTGPANLARACKSHHARLVHYSTDFVFDGNGTRPYLETDPTHPLSVYGSSKLMGEKLIAEINPKDWMVLRTAWLYGKNGNSFPATMLKFAQAGKPLRVVNDQRGCPTNTHDLALATLALIDSKGHGIFHVTNSGITSWFDFAVQTLKFHNIAADIQPVTTEDWFKIRPKQAHRPMYSALDLAHYHKVTGQVTRQWEVALREYCNS